MTTLTRSQKQALADAANRCRRDGCHRPQQRNHYCEQHAIWVAKKGEYNRLIDSGDAVAAGAMSAGLRAYDAPCDCPDCLTRVEPLDLDWEEGE